MGLAGSVKPEVISDFTSAIFQADKILPEFTGVAQAGGEAVGDWINRFGSFLTSGDTEGFLSFIQAQAIPDTNSLTNAMSGTANGIEGLVEALNPVSKAFLDAFGGLGTAIGWISRADPLLVQLGASALIAGVSVGQLAKGFAAITDSRLLTGITGAVTGLRGWTSETLAAAAGGDALADAGSGVADAAEAAAPAVAEAAEAAGGLGIGAGAAALATGALAAIPVAGWAVLGAVALTGLVTVLARASSSGNALIASMAQQDLATGANVAGYQQLSQQLSGASGRQVAYRMVLDSTSSAMARFGVSGDATGQAMQAVSQAQQQAAASAAKYAVQVSSLASRFSITQQAAVGLVNDINTLDQATSTASQRTAAYNSMIGILSGGLIAAQLASLGWAQSFLTLHTDADTAGASMTGLNQASVTLQQQFFTMTNTINQQAEAFDKHGQITDSDATSLAGLTAKMAAMAGGSVAATQVIEGQIVQEEMWGAKTSTVTTAIDALGRSMGLTTPQVEALTNSIEQSGTTSAATEGERAALIRDLEKAGDSAQTATKLVDDLIGAIAGLHSKTITVTAIENDEAARAARTSRAPPATPGASPQRQAVTSAGPAPPPPTPSRRCSPLASTWCAPRRCSSTARRPWTR